MATENRATFHPLIEDLQKHPGRYDFLQAIRILQAALGGPRVGCAARPELETIEFLQLPTLEFLAAPIKGLRLGPKAILLVQAFGLLNSNGPLPLWMTGFACRQQARRQEELDESPQHLERGLEKHPFWTESAFVAFCHLLQHRFVALFYRAWESQHKAPALDRPEGHPLLSYFHALTGLLASTTHGGPYAELSEAAAFHAGHLVPVVRHAEGLRSILSDEFGVPVEIGQFVGRWQRVPVESRFRLMGPREAMRLAPVVVLGERFFDYQMSFRVRLGPLSLAEYQRFLPGQPDHQRLKDLVTVYCGDELGWDLRLVLKKSEIPPFRVTCRQPEAGRVRLGWTSWLVVPQRPRATDGDELILTTQPEPG